MSEESMPSEAPVESPEEVVGTPEEKPQPRILKTKVDGREVEVDEETLLRNYSKYSAADKRFAETAKMKKEVEAFQKRLEEDPESVFNDPKLTFNKREMAEKWLMAELQREMEPELTAEQQRIKELQEENEKYKNKEQEELTAKEQAEFQQIVEQRREQISSTLQEAINMSPLSKNPETNAETIREMAMYLRTCRDAGYDPSPTEIAEHVNNRYMSSFKNLTDNLSGEDLINVLGPSIIKKLRQYDLGQLESRNARQEPEQADAWVERESRSQREFVDPRELLSRPKR